MRRLIYIVLTAGIVLAAASPAFGQGLALNVRAGTLGPGIELSTRLTSHFNVRIGGNYLDYSRSDYFEDEDVKLRADSDLHLASGAAFIDYYPFKRIFHLTGGFVYNKNHATVFVTPTDSYTVDAKVLSPERIGTLSAQISHVAPVNTYFGLGFGNALRGSRLGLLLDVGFLYTDAPRVEAEGTGLIKSTARQSDDLEQDLSGIKLYPNVSIGLSFRL